MYKDWFTFHVPVGCENFTGRVQFESHAPITAYQKHDQNRFCFSILASGLK